MAAQFTDDHETVWFTLWFRTHTNHRYAKLFCPSGSFWSIVQNFAQSSRLLRGVQALSRRTIYPSRSSVEISQFMGCGVPIVSTSVDEAFLIEKVGCGIVCDSQERIRGGTNPVGTFSATTR